MKTFRKKNGILNIIIKHVIFQESVELGQTPMSVMTENVLEITMEIKDVMVDKIVEMEVMRGIVQVSE